MNIRRILSMEKNLYLRNLKQILFQKEYEIPKRENKDIRCFYLDAASYNNLGDQAIAYAMCIFLGDIFGIENLIVIKENEVLSYLKDLERKIQKEDIIVLSGGGNMGDLYPRYEAIRRIIIKRFPDNKIIIFPQTIDYSLDKYGKREFSNSRKIYNNHKKLYICAREKKSYEIMSKVYNHVLLIPDIVLYLKNRIKLEPIYSKKQVGICLRHDKESLLDSIMENNIIEMFKDNEYELCFLSTMSKGKVDFSTNQIRREKIIEKLKEFKECELIFTDRLHGMIFSILADKPCIIADNSNHKISGVYEMLQQFGVELKGIMEVTKTGLNGIPRDDFKNYIINVDTMYGQLKNVLINK